MPTGLERIAEKARQEPTLRFTSLAHHLTQEGLWKALHHISPSTAPGTDGVTQPDAVDTFATWAEPMLQAVHRRGYHPPAVRRVWIPKPGKTAKRPLGVPSVADRVLQRCVAEVLAAIPDLAQTYLLAKVLGALLVDAIRTDGPDFSPYGFPLTFDVPRRVAFHGNDLE